MNKLKHIVLISCSVLALAVLNSCKTKESAPPVQQRNFAAEGFTKATVINYELDGCVWMIQLESGEKFEPSNLTEEFMQDKLYVWVKYQLKKGAVSICMAGKMITISEIAKR